jgi:hypothetical protein
MFDAEFRNIYEEVMKLMHYNKNTTRKHSYDLHL